MKVSHQPEVHFSVGRPPSPITPQNNQWTASLPLSPVDLNHRPLQSKAPTYGQYFSRAMKFLLADRMSLLIRPAKQILGRRVECGDIKRIDIHLVKHGALYHPSKVTVDIGRDTIRLVLNVAVGPHGRAVLEREFNYLKELNLHLPESYIPEVFGWGNAPMEDGESALGMFLGQWFEGFHEFHLTPDRNGTGYQWQVWDEDQGPWLLTRKQVQDLFRRVSRILVYYFNPITFEAILDWHHAAGDFVLRPYGDGVEVRLVTVRRYKPLIQWDELQPPSVQDLLTVIVVYLLRVSLWLRLDRLNGTESLTMADSIVLPPIWQGFVEGLRDIIKIHGLPIEFVQIVEASISMYSIGQLTELGNELIRQMNPGETTADLLKGHLAEHVQALTAAVKNLL